MLEVRQHGFVRNSKIDQAGDFIPARGANLIDQRKAVTRRPKKATGREMPLEGMPRNGFHLLISKLRALVSMGMTIAISIPVAIPVPVAVAITVAMAVAIGGRAGALEGGECPGIVLDQINRGLEIS